MAEYIAHSANFLNFTLHRNDKLIGELKYVKWYSFNAEIQLRQGRIYQLEAKGIWHSKIELKDYSTTLLEFSMGWHGILAATPVT